MSWWDRHRITRISCLQAGRIPHILLWEQKGEAIEPIKPIKAVFVPDPKKSLAVRLYGPDHVVAQAVWIASPVLVIHKRGWRTLEPAEPSLHSHPHYSCCILENCVDCIIWQAVRVAGLISIPGKDFALRVKFEQSAVNRTNP